MANELKLEIYKLKLINKENGKRISFRDLFRKKFSLYAKGNEVITDQDFFKKYYNDFLNNIDGTSYQRNDKRKKGFSIKKDKDGNDNPKSRVSSLLAKDWSINGILKGGKYDRQRTLGIVEDTQKDDDINRNHIICDLFYFLINVPLNHSEAIFIIQSYTEIKISDIFRDFISEYFIYQDEIKNEIETFVPQSLKEKYINRSHVRSLSFSTIWRVNPGFDEPTQDQYDIQIKVEIIDKNKKKVKIDRITSFFDAFKKSRISVSKDQEKELDEFVEKKAKFGDGKKSSTVDIDFDKEDHIKLAIPLADFNIHPDENGIPNFEQIDKYSRTLLSEILEEINPKNGMDDL